MNSEYLKKEFAGHGIDLAVHCSAVLDSTNTEARRLLPAGCARESLVVAEKQTAGQGRLGRVWESSNNRGIWASLALPECGDPHKNIRALSIAIAEELQLCGAAGVSIKWPNDILIGNKKVCGILSEKMDVLPDASGLILGFGININQTEKDFFGELAGIAGSLRMATCREHSMEKILINIIRKYYAWLKYPAPDVFTRYKTSLSSLGRKCVIDGRTVFTETLTDDGGLVIVDEYGKKETIYSGTLRYLRE